MEKHGKGPQQMIADLMGWSIGQEQFYFKMFHNVVILVFPKKKKAIHKNLHYPQSLAEKNNPIFVRLLEKQLLSKL